MEYRAITTTVEEVQGVHMLIELGVKVPLPIGVLSDNQGATFIANHPICHSKMKHVAKDFHFVWDKAE